MSGKTKIFPLLLMSVLLSGCLGTTGSGASDIEKQIAQQNQAIQQMQMQISGVQPAQADTWSQIQVLQQDVAMLRGQIDDLNNALKGLGGVGMLGEVVARHDRALWLVEAQLGMNLQMKDPSSAATLDIVTAPPIVVSPEVPVVPTQQNLDTAQALYDAGIKSFNSRNYQRGLNEFSDFTKAYADHKLVSNAWFWQGECLYQMGKYPEAALAYEKVISKYPNSNKGPASYLKQGMSFIRLDKEEAGLERLKQLVAKYPKAPEATRAKQIIDSL